MPLRHLQLPIAAAVVVLMAASACERAERPDEPWTSPVTFDTAQAWVSGGDDSVRLVVEVARSDAQRQVGLMMRSELDPGSGMIFLFDAERAGSEGFWMWRTRIPLDIAFLDRDGTVLRVLSMDPCPSDAYPAACPTYVPGVAYWSALEVIRGWFAEQGLGEGATVRLETRGAGG